ncbi:MAG: hypothetical protein HFG33_02100 [Bacilli bacterium]|nr:hypothetical protein [Bacilli bacterium]
MYTNEKDYRRLLSINALITLIFDIRFYDKMIPSSMSLKEKLFFIDDNIGLSERIDTIIRYSDNGLLDLSDTTFKEATNCEKRLAKKKPFMQEEIRRISLQNKTYLERCGEIKPLAIELMEFSHNMGLDYRHDINLNFAIEKVLKKLNFSTAIREREYLLSFCINPQWFYCFFFENRSNKNKRHDIDFNDLIASIFIGGMNGRDWLLKTMIKIYLEKGLGTLLEKDNLKRLISSSPNRELLDIFKNHIDANLVEETLNEILSDFDQMEEDHTTPQIIIALYRQILRLFESDTALEICAKVFVRYPHGDIWSRYLSQMLDKEKYKTFITIYNSNRPTNNLNI